MFVINNKILLREPGKIKYCLEQEEKTTNRKVKSTKQAIKPATSTLL